MNKSRVFADIQTLEDLNILGKYKTDSIFSLFNHTKTKGGERFLTEMLENPLDNLHEIQKRQYEIQSLAGKNLKFPLAEEDFEALSQLILSYPQISSYQAFVEVSKRYFLHLIGDQRDFEYHIDLIKRSIQALKKIKIWFEIDLEQVQSDWIDKIRIRVLELFKNLQYIVDFRHDKLSYKDQLAIEKLLRSNYHADLEYLIKTCYYLDAYISISNVMHARNFVMPIVNDGIEGFSFTNVFHPTLVNGIGNSLSLSSKENFMFLTGANMAGKSTIMKTIGVCIYLAHIGFPVSASHMDFSLMDGIYTSINLPDNINKGYSHFYAEVLRVKEVAQAVASGKRFLVIFDELFKGTNVKDAYDATYEVSKAFMEYKRCYFVLSTHIVEVGDALKESNQTVKYRYMPTIMEGNIAKYPYVMKEGVSEDRHGMLIIKQEGILDLFS